MFIPAKDMLIAPREIGVDLARQKRILGNICAARVVVKREDKEPAYADDHTEKGQVWRYFEELRMALKEHA